MQRKIRERNGVLEREREVGNGDMVLFVWFCKCPSYEKQVERKENNIYT